MVNKPQLHPVGSFAERHPANSPHGDFSQTFPQTFPQPTATNRNQPKPATTRFCPEKGGVLRTSESKCQFIRKKAGFHGQTLPHKAIIIRNNRATVARWLGADLPPSVLEGGARLAGGPGPPRVIPRRDVVNKPQLHPVGSFAERHPANSPPRLLLSDIPSSIPADIPATNQNQQQLDFVRRKGVFYGQVSQNDNSSVKR